MTTMMKRPRARAAVLAGVLSLALAALVLAACYPGEVTNVAELDLVVTQFDTTYVWAGPATFHVFDTVVHLEDTVDAGNNIPLSRQYDSLVLATIRQNMLAYGYAERNDPDSTDYLVVTSALAVKNYTVNYWYPYYPYWGWGGYYPYYPPYYTVSSYEVGTVFLDMYHVAARDTLTDLIPLPWRGILNGPLTSSSVSTRLKNGINQAFAQSPYLKIN